MILREVINPEQLYYLLRSQLQILLWRRLSHQRILLSFPPNHVSLRTDSASCLFENKVPVSGLVFHTEGETIHRFNVLRSGINTSYTDSLSKSIKTRVKIQLYIFSPGFWSALLPRIRITAFKRPFQISALGIVSFPCFGIGEDYFHSNVLSKIKQN